MDLKYIVLMHICLYRNTWITRVTGAANSKYRKCSAVIAGQMHSSPKTLKALNLFQCLSKSIYICWICICLYFTGILFNRWRGNGSKMTHGSQNVFQIKLWETWCLQPSFASITHGSLWLIRRGHLWTSLLLIWLQMYI